MPIANNIHFCIGAPSPTSQPVGTSLLRPPNGVGFRWADAVNWSLQVVRSLSLTLQQASADPNAWVSAEGRGEQAEGVGAAFMMPVNKDLVDWRHDEL